MAADELLLDDVHRGIDVLLAAATGIDHPPVDMARASGPGRQQEERARCRQRQDARGG
ncbi:MAG: hypothetical protein ACFN04_07345 [Propionibacterium acidifaciens]